MLILHERAVHADVSSLSETLVNRIGHASLTMRFSRTVQGNTVRTASARKGVASYQVADAA
jgi:hypothetical protein